ncbi:hypothetical protein CC2G_005221 [Coprinopsis cinerea AmutBmut pab1-1]|nr:hypothetical protein CC2G_005221 [Coprinopsis cinerea AmutBmut pab1-1]
MVQGTNTPAPSGGDGLSWTCSLDGRPFETTRGTRQLHRWPLCTSPVVANGDHLLTINVTNTSSRTTFWVDEFTIDPSVDAVRDLGEMDVIFDENDPAVEYLTGEWVRDQSNSVLSTDEGASVRIRFSGTAATWVGRGLDGFPRGNSTGFYAVDNRDAIPFTILENPAEAGRIFNVELFGTGPLPNGQHTLVVTYQGPAAPITFDKLLVENGDPLIAPASVLPSSTQQPSSSTSEVATPITTLPADNLETDSGSSGTPVGAIVGGTLGGLAIIAITFVLIFYVSKRRRNRDSAFYGGAMFSGRSQPAGLPPETAQITPFTYPTNQPPPSNGYSSTNPSYGGPMSSQTIYMKSPSGPIPVHPSHHHQTSTDWSSSGMGSSGTGPGDITSPTSLTNTQNQSVGSSHEPPPAAAPPGDSKAPLAEASTSGPAVVHHQDSGVRLRASDVVHVPPSYSP